MTEASMQEGQRLQRLIKDYEIVLGYFSKEDPDIKSLVGDYFTGTRMIPCKDQMAQVAINAIIDSCESCLETAREKFDNL